MPPTHVKSWQKYLRNVEVRGALPVKFKVSVWDDVSQQVVVGIVMCMMEVPDVNTGQKIWIQRTFELPTFTVSKENMQQKVYEWTRFMYMHEMREQFYVNGKREDVPEH